MTKFREDGTIEKVLDRPTNRESVVKHLTAPHTSADSTRIKVEPTQDTDEEEEQELPGKGPSHEEIRDR